MKLQTKLSFTDVWKAAFNKVNLSEKLTEKI